MVDGRPTSFNVYVRWFDDVGTDYIDMTETLVAVRNATNDGYTAWSSMTFPRIGIEIDDSPDIAIYDVTVHVDIWGWIYASHTWENVDLTSREPWGSELLDQTTIAHHRFIEARLLA